MRRLCRISTCALLLLLGFCAPAQEWPGAPPSNLRQKELPAGVDSIVVDTLPIVPGTFRLEGIMDSTFRVDYLRSTLYFLHRTGALTVKATYRVFPHRFPLVSQRVSYDSVVNYFYSEPFAMRQGAGGGPLDFGNLRYSGSFGRGLSFGNNQDAVVNSAFQLQLEGMLGDSIEVAAALSDNNIPIQPDGTTQQLNEFDQVFLQFRKRGWQLNLGDIDLRQSNLYFLSFYKRLQGISFSNTQRLGPRTTSTTLVSGSIAKGKFNRNVFQGLEGNQGPYRLSGANNEFFFVVLGGTERVYLDGELLNRGEDADYVINYNTAEVTFMPRRMITKDARIQVEFEYADRNYLNANLYAFQEVGIGSRLKLRVGAFNNSDARNSSINQTLNPAQKQFLFEVGDSVSRALYPTAFVDTFATDKILYERVADSASADSFYRYSTDPQRARYNLSFTEVGAGRGNYLPEFNGANGKVYRYVAPLNGQPQGAFEPVMLLVTPKKQQIISLAGEYILNDRNQVKTEVAISNVDLNTFSPKDGGDDAASATRVQWVNTQPLNTARKLELQTTLDFERVQQRFRPLERLRYVEFTREWGLPLVVAPADESILRLASSLKTGGVSGLTYQLTRYGRSDQYRGIQHLLAQSGKWAGFVMNNGASLTTFRSGMGKGRFWRPVVDLSRQMKDLGNLRAGFRYALEQNEVRDERTDTLTALSFAFDTYTAYLKTDEAKSNRYGISFFTRSDRYPIGRDLVRGDRSYNLNGSAELLRSQKHQVRVNATYRVLRVNDKRVSRQQDDRTLLGRTEYLLNEWKGMLSGNALYELGTGQEQRRDFAYLEVPAGQGEYAWNDYNSDRVQQLNEFEVALFQDQAKFIRIFVPTNQFIKAAFTTLNYNFALNPRALLGGGNLKGWKKLATRFTVQTSMQKSKKSTAGGREIEFNPFKYGLTDTALITLQTALLHTLSFNRFSQKWGFDISRLQNTGKSLLTYGYESRLLQDLNLKVRWNLSPALTLDVIGREGGQSLFTPKFSNRNYDLQLRSAEPRLTFVRGTVFRLQGGYRWETKKNAETWGGEEARSGALSMETKYNVLQSASLTGRFTRNAIRYPHPANSTVAYIMLDGLQPGTNYLWSAELTKRLLNNVELNIQYEGRKPGDTRTVHVGRASVRALF